MGEICISQHWHFYQPRGNDYWASQINNECYKPNSNSGILENISFNIGPTLIEWFKENDKETLESIIQSDKGQAIAQPYNHRIMPLIRYDEDLKTQIIWGKKHFKKYFKREPKGMWLPETATDKRVCKELVNQGIEYTIGSWNQKRGYGNSSKPHKIDLGDNKSIIYFFFNPVSSDIAFNRKIRGDTRYLDNADIALDELVENRDSDFMLLAYDGETFGHHHEFADKWAAYFPESVEKRDYVEMKTLDQIIKEVDPIESDIHERSSWSCLCGNLSRWTDGCDCAGGEKNYQRPLLDVAENQEDKVHEIYQNKASMYLKDIWKARNEYIDLKLNNISREDFIRNNFKGDYSNEIEEKVLNLLKAEYHTQLSFTSCGWFFPHIHIQTGNNINDLYKASDYIRKATGYDISDNLKQLDWMLQE